MNFLNRRFVVDSEKWKPEAIDKRAVREANSSEVKAAISETMEGNKPFRIGFVDEQAVPIGQMMVSGAMTHIAPLNETNNWVNFGFTTQVPPRAFGSHPYGLFCENRGGNDSQGVDLNDILHSQYHGHISDVRFPIDISLSASKRSLPEIGKQLSKKLFEEFTKENKQNH